MTLKTVGDVLLGITAGKSLKTLDRPALPHEVGILKISAVTWGTFRADENKAMPIDFNANGIPRAMSGDILISRANTRELVGAPVMVDKDYQNLLLSDKLLKLIPNEDLVDPRYLLHSLKSEKSRIHFSKCAGGTSGSMTNITQGDIRSAPIHLPSLEEQRRIAAILDKAEALRAKRREAIAKLDLLLQSVFLEMFGDPIVNPKRLSVFKSGDLFLDKPRIGTTKPANGEGCLVVRVGEIGGLNINIEKCSRVELLESEKEKYLVQSGDILIARAIGSKNQLGKSSFYSGYLKEDLVFDSHVMRLRPDKDKINPFWFYCFINTDGGKKILQSKGGATAVQFNINSAQAADLDIPLPPLIDQKEFEKLALDINRKISVMRKQVLLLDTLKSSLNKNFFS